MNRTKTFLCLMVFACGALGPLARADVAETQTTNATNENMVTLDIVKGGASSYSIVYGSGGQHNAEQLQKTIKSKTGVTLPIKSDSSTPTEKEIVLGPVSTRPGHSTFRSILGSYGYRFGIYEGKLMITASDANHMAAALFQFEYSILADSELIGSGYFKFSALDDQLANFDQTQITLRNLINNGYSWYSLSLTDLFRCWEHDYLNIAQGAGTDGTYIYVVNRDRAESVSRVYKYTMSGTCLNYTKEFYTFHSNDLTVDTKNGRVLVSHGGKGSPNGVAYNTISSVRTSDMAVLSEGGIKASVKDGITAITYNPTTNMYAGCRGHIIHLMKESASYFTADKTTGRTPATEGSTAYTSQGAGSDADFIYFPMSASSSTLIPVYNWDGTYRNWNFKVSSTYEAESMFEANGVYYIYYYVSGSGGLMRRLNISITYNTRL